MKNYPFNLDIRDDGEAAVVMAALQRYRQQAHKDVRTFHNEAARIARDTAESLIERLETAAFVSN